jgi:hypothetical protein
MRSKVLSGVALFAIALLAAPLSWADEKKGDDEKYTIKAAKFPAKGKPVKANEKITLKSVSKIADGDGNVLMNVNKTKTMTRVYVEKTLEVDDKANKRKKFTRKFEVAKDVEDDEAENKPYQGRTIVYEKSDGEWKLTAEGNPELDASDLKELSEQINRGERPEDALYPKEAVKVGGKWTLNGKDVAKFFDTLKMDGDSVKGEGKLVKAYKKDGKQWGTLEYTITFESELGPLKKVKGELKVNADQALDGSTTAHKSTFKIKWADKRTIEANCMKLNVDFKVDLSVEGEQTDVKDDKK